MDHGPGIPFFQEILAFLVATVIVVPVFQRLRVSPILGFLGLGVVIGPSGIGLVDDPEGVSALAELGIMFMLFTIGLELAPRRLWAMRQTVFGLGSLQVFPTALAIGLIAWVWGNTATASIIIGMALALSSTAIVMQLLIENREISSRLGRASFGVLLLQDVMVIPVLFAVVVLSDQTSPLPVALGIGLLRAAIGMAVIFVVGRWVLRPLLRLLARTHSREVFMAAVVLALLATAWVTESAGLSLSLGAFLAGILLAETEFEHQVETDIQPFRGLLLNLFFIAVGMNLDVRLLTDSLAWIVPSVLGLVGIKIALAFAAGRLFGLGNELSLKKALLLGPSGEFAFVIVGAALTAGLVAPDIANFMLAVAGLSMILTPFALQLGRLLGPMVRDTRGHAALATNPAEDLSDHVVIAGYGRVGEVVAKLLDGQNVPYVALDEDIGRVRDGRAAGTAVFLGDASHKPLLDRAGADRAAAIVVTMNDPKSARKALETVRHSWPKLPVYVRAHNDEHSEELIAAGAAAIVPETLECGRQLAVLTLKTLGMPADVATQLRNQLPDPAPDS